MSEKMFGTRVDDVDSTIINITRDGEDFAWFLSDIVTDKQVEKVVDKLNKLYEENEQLRQQSKNYRKSRDKWRTIALQKEEQLKDCDNDCFNCRFYNKICDFCTKFNITSSTSGDGV